MNGEDLAEVSQVIAEEHKDEVRPISCSTTSNEWYSKKWNAPHACGALMANALL